MPVNVYYQNILFKVQFDAAERACSDGGGINCGGGAGAALDDSNGDLETSKTSGAPGM
jgi:hypothetical protein